MTKKKHEHAEEKEPKKEAVQDPKDVQIAELTDTLQRLQAEFENYKKRVDKEKESFAKYCNGKMVARLLPLLDSFEQAIKNGNGADIIKRFDLSPQQKRVFDSALALKEFTAAELFSKSGVQFSEIYDIINILLNKGYFIKEGNKYKLSSAFNLNFNEFNIYEKPDFYKVEGNKLDKKINVHDAVSFLNNFIRIKNQKECWLETYN